MYVYCLPSNGHFFTWYLFLHMMIICPFEVDANLNFTLYSFDLNLVFYVHLFILCSSFTDAHWMFTWCSYDANLFVFVSSAVSSSGTMLTILSEFGYITLTHTSLSLNLNHTNLYAIAVLRGPNALYVKCFYLSIVSIVSNITLHWWDSITNMLYIWVMPGQYYHS